MADDGFSSELRLPNFWTRFPRDWFRHVEAVFEHERIRSDMSRVNHVLATLNEEAVRSVSDLISLNVSYADLKDRLISKFSEPQFTRYRPVVELAGMDDRRPSILLRDMRAVFPNTLDEAVLKKFWLQMLPSDVRTIISNIDGPLSITAQFADYVLQASSSRAAYDAQSNSDERLIMRLRALQSAIRALGPRIARLAIAQSQLRRRNARSRRDTDHLDDEINLLWGLLSL